MSAIDDLALQLDGLVHTFRGVPREQQFAEMRALVDEIEAEHRALRDVLAAEVDTTDVPLDELAQAALHAARNPGPEFVVRFPQRPAMFFDDLEAATAYAKRWGAPEVENRHQDVVWVAIDG